MSAHQPEDAARNDVLHRVLGYFDQQALAAYKSEAHRYEIESDSFEGTLKVRSDYWDKLERPSQDEDYVNIQFGYRTLQSGDLAIVVWLPDLEKATANHQERWRGFYLGNPQWIDGPDDRFQNWIARYIDGSWEVENGPKFHLIEVIKTINALTSEVLGLPLYRHIVDEGLGFPSAQNSHRYQDAHGELYGCVVDGLDKECLKKLAQFMRAQVNADNEKTIATIQKLLPELGPSSNFDSATSLISKQRRFATHSKRPKAESYPAFETFSQDLELCLKSQREILRALEKRFGVDGKMARDRNESKRSLPKIACPAEPSYSIGKAIRMNGKTVEKVEFGFREHWEGVHESEALIIHFTDGTILGIDTGSNAFNLAGGTAKLSPEDFHVDFRLSWVPSLTGDTTEL